ncbi:MAG: hypothetical protein HY979_01895 [Candidatus Magasanikbacteria bacterium]|nr:hypothetical protein [Candidatus Magasanikbacteria bacterium]
MSKRIFLALFFLFIASAIVLPLAMPNCGMNGFHLGMGAGAAQGCGGINDLAHLSWMSSLLIGIVAAAVVLAVYRQSQKLTARYTWQKTFLDFYQRFKEQLSLGRLKPFDQLLVAYAAGVIQPKTF